MGLIPDSQVKRLRDHFRDCLVEPVEIHVQRPIAEGTANDDLELRCDEAVSLLGEVCGLSERLVGETVELTAAASDPEDAYPFPRIVVQTPAGGLLRYVGLPSGSEFPNFIRLLVSVSSRDSGLSQESRDDLATVVGPVYLRVFVTPT